MSDDLKATTVNVSGMTCGGCARKIDTALRGIEGVRDVSLHYPDPTLGVLHGAGVSAAEIRDAITALGFEVSVPSPA
jgi:copper chaperone CopZ